MTPKLSDFRLWTSEQWVFVYKDWAQLSRSLASAGCIHVSGGALVIGWRGLAVARRTGLTWFNPTCLSSSSRLARTWAHRKSRGIRDTFPSFLHISPWISPWTKAVTWQVKIKSRDRYFSTQVSTHNKVIWQRMWIEREQTNKQKLQLNVACVLASLSKGPCQAVDLMGH